MEKVFENIEQDVCLVYMSNEADAKPYVKYATFKNMNNMDIIFENIIMYDKPFKKLSNCIFDAILVQYFFVGIFFPVKISLFQK